MRCRARGHRARPAQDRELLLIHQSTLEILAASCVQLPLAALARFLEVLVSPQVGQDSGLLTLLLEASQGAFERLPFFDPDGGQTYPSSRTAKTARDTMIRPGSERSPLGTLHVN